MDVSLLPTQGYWGPHAFMAAQTPLPHTVADFCSMILQYRIPAVVMLSDRSQTDEVLSKHWPELEKRKPGAFGGDGENKILVLTEKLKRTSVLSVLITEAFNPSSFHLLHRKGG